jgi:hypothetical protein
VGDAEIPPRPPMIPGIPAAVPRTLGRVIKARMKLEEVNRRWLSRFGSGCEMRRSALWA